jgi:hypothetical protein
MIPGGRHMECAYYFVDGTWNVPTTLWTAHGMCLLLCGRHMECAYYFDFGRLCLNKTRQPRLIGLANLAGLGPRAISPFDLCKLPSLDQLFRTWTQAT